MVPKEVEREITQVVYKPVTEERTIAYTEMVPEKVERIVRVPETRLVAREIEVEVPGGPILR
jgi:hypothetical protein